MGNHTSGGPEMRGHRRRGGGLCVLAVCAGIALARVAAAVACDADAVPVGDVCVDKYEASVWGNPPGGDLGPGRTAKGARSARRSTEFAHLGDA